MARRTASNARPRLALCVGTLAAVCAAGAHAQSASSTASSVGTGYGFSAGELTRGIDVSTTSASGTGNRVFVDGVTKIGSDQSVFANGGATGAVDAFSGVGATGQASAIGNNLNVSVSGSYNTVIVNSSQVNTGNVTASTVLNGKVNLDGSQ